MKLKVARTGAYRLSSGRGCAKYMEQSCGVMYRGQ